MKNKSSVEIQCKGLSLISKYINTIDLFRHYFIKYDIVPEVILLLESKDIDVQKAVYKFLKSSLVQSKDDNKDSMTNSLIKRTDLMPTIIR